MRWPFYLTKKWPFSPDPNNMARYSVTIYYKEAVFLIDYREILRLHSLGNSRRSIAQQVQSSRDTVTSTITVVNAVDGAAGSRAE